MPDEKADITPTSDPKFVLQSKKMDLEAGWLGRVIGSPKNAANNMAFLTVVLTFAAGFVVGLAYPSARVEFWKLIIPIVTLTLGYVFGKNSSS